MKYLTFMMLIFVQSSFAEIKLKEGKIFLIKEPAFQRRLEISPLTAAPTKTNLKQTGFIVANTESTYVDDRFVRK